MGWVTGRHPRIIDIVKDGITLIRSVMVSIYHLQVIKQESFCKLEEFILISFRSLISDQ